MSGYVWHGKPPPPPPSPPVNPCACGCGEEVTIAARSDRRTGAVQGQPRRYVRGHNPRPAGPRTPRKGTPMAHGPTCTCRLCIEQYGPIRPPRPPKREVRHG